MVEKEKNLEAVQELEHHASVIRGLISYHNRMMLVGTCSFVDHQTGKCGPCKTAEQNNNECPRTTLMNDVYLKALEASLKLIYDKIAAIKEF